MATLFTKIINKEIPCYLIAENENYISFLDIMPLTPGHVLVVPKIENDYIFDLDSEILSGLILFAQKIAVAQKKVIHCTRIGIAVIGLEVPHTHIHLVPINHVGDINFEKPKLKPTPKELTEVANLIKSAL